VLLANEEQDGNGLLYWLSVRCLDGYAGAGAICETAGEEGWKSATCVSIESMEERQPIYTEVGGGLAGMPS
jgi:hypothetical protein